MRALISTIILSLAAALPAVAENWTPLLDAELSNFEIWIGVPHTSVKGLPEGAFQAEDVRKGEPLGLNADIKNVFSMIEEEGEPVLSVTGEIYGGLTTKKEYENYHFSARVKWGDKKWEPRLERLRDSGVLYHCHGKHGAFWNVWKASLECQVEETNLGDFIPLGGVSARVRVSPVEGEKRARYDSASDTFGKGYISAAAEPDKAHGEWNLIEIYSLGDTSAHYVNGQLVMVVEQARKKDGTPLTKGQIQLQSEAAECYYKDVKIRPITALPKAVIERLR